MITTAAWITAGIFAGVAVLLSQVNHSYLSIAFGIISVAILLITLFVHRIESKKQIKAKNKYEQTAVLNNARKVIKQASHGISLDHIHEFKTVYENNRVFLQTHQLAFFDELLSDLQDLRIYCAERTGVGSDNEKIALVAKERELLNRIEASGHLLEEQFKSLSS